MLKTSLAPENRFMKTGPILLSLILLTANVVWGAAAERFTFVIVPDVQYATSLCPNFTDNQFSWIAGHRDSLAVAYVLQVGDFTNISSASEWAEASHAVSLIEKAAIPYLLCPGNHDYGIISGLDNFNASFPVSRIQSALQKSGAASWGGSYPAGKNDNSFHLLTAGGVRWVLLSLANDVGGDSGVMAWANGVATAFPDRKIILLTHNYLQPGGAKSGAGRALWNNLVNRHANFLFVICGHDTPVVRSVSVTAFGGAVYEMMVDWQNLLSPCSSDNSYLRMLEFDTRARTVSAWTYAPPTGAMNTDAENRFVLTGVDFGPVLSVSQPSGGSDSRFRAGLPGNAVAVRRYSLTGRLLGIHSPVAGGNGRVSPGVYIVARQGPRGPLSCRTMIQP